MYRIILKKRVAKDIKSLPKRELVKILVKINKTLSKNPFAKGGNPKKLKESKYLRLRVGNFRIFYTVKDTNVFISKIKHRKDAYK